MGTGRRSEGRGSGWDTNNPKTSPSEIWKQFGPLDNLYDFKTKFKVQQIRENAVDGRNPAPQTL